MQHNKSHSVVPSGRGRPGFVLLGLALAVTGCKPGDLVNVSKRQPDQIVAVVSDETASTADNQVVFNPAVKSLFQHGYFGKSELGLFRLCNTTTLNYSGPGKWTPYTETKLVQMQQPCRGNCGTDVTDSFKNVIAWLSKPEYAHARKLVILQTDGIADPTKTSHGTRHYPDVTQFAWPKDVELHVYGVSPDRQDILKKAWKDMNPAPCFHLTGETPEPSHLGLRQNLL